MGESPGTGAPPLEGNWTVLYSSPQGLYCNLMYHNLERVPRYYEVLESYVHLLHATVLFSEQVEHQVR